MRIEITAHVSTEEMKSYAKFQDGIAEAVRAISKEFGAETPKKPSVWKQLKVALGGTISESASFNQMGTSVDVLVRANKKDGFNISINFESDPKVAQIVYETYGKVIEAYIPAFVTSISSLRAASAIAELKFKEGERRLKKLG